MIFEKNKAIISKNKLSRKFREKRLFYDFLPVERCYFAFI